MAHPTTAIHMPTADLLSRFVAPDTAPTDWPTARPHITDQELRPALRQLTMELGESGTAVAAISPDLDDHSLSVVAWNLIALLSKPVPQYDSGELVFAVEVRSGEAGSSHYSASNSSKGLHTDGSLLPQPPDLGALLCLSPAAEGGETVLVDVQLLVDGLSASDPALVELLEKPHPFATEDQGLGIRQWAPVLTATSTGARLRYLRRYLAAGWQRAAKPAPDRLAEAFDIIDSIAEDPENQIAYPLDRGEVLIWRNFRFIHGRRPFTEQDRRRRLVRIYGQDDHTRTAYLNGADE
jgi:alpha-ketoglutarate-dependent taurine dioxygenase